jgi:hypothetical protein
MNPVDRVRTLLKNAQSIAALTGAGVSAESGVSTFRGANGLWKEYRAEDLATPEAFARDPKLVWEWYDWRRQPQRAEGPRQHLDSSLHRLRYRAARPDSVAAGDSTEVRVRRVAAAGRRVVRRSVTLRRVDGGGASR